ncbi:molybdopterin adenylyltransferase [Rhodopseudomonas rhenobacensis]|uniref:Molybdopterin adenylyltransferase n=1 Tax=Rhodopseudomonas rhenobacensis TaxID=87461 RepID=A0A7W8DXY3_9BRAD|nr:molybdopterin adenylyltransferase [Rhodopseudomonas rhenobacensis]MBB5046250.1 molybdopterin adenylyltransferase [Rhodopseudomonas rhenobacensis]
MVRIGILTVSDRAARGEYEDLGGPAVVAWLSRAITSPWEAVGRVIPDGVDSVREALIAMCDVDKVDLLLTTGGTGPSPRDCTPEATEAVIERLMPGFGEAMRLASLQHVPTAILSRQLAGSRGKTLIINMPGKPASIAVCLDAVFAAVPYCLDLMGAGRIETDASVIAAFRPK